MPFSSDLEYTHLAMHKELRLDELLFNRRKFQLTLPSLTEETEPTPAISLPSLAAVPSDLEQVILEARAEVKSISDELTEKVEDKKKLPEFALQLQRWADQVVSMVSDLLSTPWRIVQNTLSRWLPASATAVRDAMLRGAARGLAQAVSRFVKQSLQAAKEPDKVHELGLTPEGRIDIVQSTVGGAAQELHNEMARLPELFQEIATDEILQELEQGLTSALQAMNPRVPPVQLPRVSAEPTTPGTPQAGLEQINALRHELTAIGIPDSVVAEVNSGTVHWVGSSASSWEFRIDTPSGWVIVGKLKRESPGNYRVEIYSTTNPSFTYSPSYLRSLVPPLEWSKFETWKEQLKYRFQVCSNYVDIEWDVDQHWDYEGSRVLLFAYPLCEDEVPEGYQFIWTLEDGNLRYLEGSPFEL